jgi:hypothetical protein
MAELTKDQLRAEYQRLLNMLDRTPPEKLGMVLVVDPRDTELTRLRAELTQLRELRCSGVCDDNNQHVPPCPVALRETVSGMEQEIDTLRATIARLEAERLPPPRACVEGEWTLPYEFIDAIYEDMRSEPFTASMEAIETVLLSYEKLTNRALILSAPTGKGEM